MEKINEDPADMELKGVEIHLWEKIKKKANEGRRTGVGITAEGDMLAALGYTLAKGTKAVAAAATESKTPEQKAAAAAYAQAKHCQLALKMLKKEIKAPLKAAEKAKYAEYDGLVINLTNYSVMCDGRQVEMPPKELELLYCLASSPNQVFTREQLLDRIWGYEYIGDTRTVDVHIKRLREKIKDHPGWKLSTVWGIGYKFETK